MTPATDGHVEGAPRRWLQLEAAAALVAGLWIYGALGGNWLLAVPLLIAPDLSTIGYLQNPRLGAVLTLPPVAGPQQWTAWRPRRVRSITRVSPARH